MNVTLRPIDESNFTDAFALRLGEGQQDYVSSPIRSLAQAYVYRSQCTPFGIYDGGQMVGYVMVLYDYDIPEYDVWHLMIDAQFQHRGCGRAAMEQVLDYIAQKPFGSSPRIALTCHKDNTAALHLYESLGFAPTGRQYDEELELVRYLP